MAFNNGWFEETKSSIAIDNLQEKIIDKANWFIFRCDFINPIVNTETGFKPANSLRNRYIQWSKLIQGNESIFLTVKGGTKLTKHDGGYLDSYYNVEYSKENVKFFKGIKSSDTGGTKFGNTDLGSFGNFNTIYDEKSFAFITTEKITAQHLSEFYLIPNLTYAQEDAEFNKINIQDYDYKFDDNDIYYIESYTNYYNENGGDFAYSQINFTNIQFNLSSSGQTIEQHILFGSPGQGYLIPNLIFNDQGQAIDWEINQSYITDKGTKAIQIEVSGVYGWVATEIWGIPINDNYNSLENKRWYPPRKLLVQQFLLPQTENFFKVKSKSNEMVYSNLNIKALSNYVSWNLAKKDLYTDNQMNYQGIIETDPENTIKTNDLDKLINETTLSVLSDNPLMNNFNNFDVSSNIWFKDEKKGINKLDLTKMFKRDGLSFNFKDIFNLMSFASLHVNQLPIETETKVTQDVKDIAGFGKFLNFITFGLLPSWRRIYNRTNVLFPTFTQIPILLNKKFYEFSSNSVFVTNTLNETNSRVWYNPKSWFTNLAGQQPTGAKGKIPLDFFQEQESSLMGALFGNQSTTSPLLFTLTDKVKSNFYNQSVKGSNLPISTIMLNQAVGKNATNKNQSFKVDEETRFIEASYSGTDLITDINGNKYIITNIGFRGLGDGDARITAYTENPDFVEINNKYNNQNFQTFINTQAKYANGNIVDWTTNITTSYLDALSEFQDTPFNWPEQNPINAPDEITDIDLNIMWDDTEDNGNFPPNNLRYLSASQFVVETFGKSISGSPSSRINILTSTGKSKPYAFREKLIFDFESLKYNNWADVLNDYQSLKIKIPDNLRFFYYEGTTNTLQFSETNGPRYRGPYTDGKITKSEEIIFDKEFYIDLTEIAQTSNPSFSTPIDAFFRFYRYQNNDFKDGTENGYIQTNITISSLIRVEGLKIYYAFGFNSLLPTFNAAKRKVPNRPNYYDDNQYLYAGFSLAIEKNDINMLPTPKSSDEFIKIDNVNGVYQFSSYNPNREGSGGLPEFNFTIFAKQKDN